MSKLIFKLGGVPDDEANDIRQLLDDNEIPFYETDSGRWGLGYAAIWTKVEEHKIDAKQLIEKYQVERLQRAKSELEELRQSGEQISRFEYFMTSPIRFAILLVFAGFLAYFTVMPFFG